MYKRISAIPWNSIHVKLVLGLFGVLIPLIALLIYNSYYSVNVVHNQVAMSNKNLISIQMNQVDSQLAEAERHLITVLASDTSTIALENAVTTDDYIMAKSEVSRRLVADLTVYPYIDGFFIYSLSREDYVDAAKGGTSYAELTNIRTAVHGRVKQLQQQPRHREATWQVQEIGGTYYLVRLLRDGDIYIGSWVSLKTLVSPLSVLNTGDTGAVLFVDKQGRALYSTKPLNDHTLDLNQNFDNYYMSGAHKDYLVVGEPSRKTNISMVAVIPNRIMLENLPYLNRVATVAATLSLLLFPVSLWFLRKVLLKPLKKMVLLMRRTGEGNFSLGIVDPPSSSDEFQLFYRTFNQMITQIEELKIDVYEEQISKQRAELKQLQLQINPHFFMNSLNILYSLAQVRQYELIQEMTICLVHYFRYMFQSGSRPLVFLKDELQHTRNYLRIQQLRFPYQLTWEVEVPEYLLNTPLPPLMIQTFVENTIKHAVKVDESITLVIEAVLDDLEEEPMVRFTIRDTGRGFSEKALEQIRVREQTMDEGGAHIGLWNVQERLRLQYGERAWMDCYNDDPHGAVVELVVPVWPEPEEREMTGNVSTVDRG